jgi:hypothetical protein
MLKLSQVEAVPHLSNVVHQQDENGSGFGVSNLIALPPPL